MANKILLADDSITIQKVVNLTFTDEGINVVTVGNGELALRKLSEDTFDLVLADIFMPGRNGYEVCEFVKTTPQHADIPVVLLVGAFEPFDKSEAARVRADGHLTKPFESRILVETVKRLLAESAVRKAAASPPPAPEPQPAYRGQVVGWDVPTTPMARQDLEDAEPGPPPYDPYVSTAKLPPLPIAAAEPEPERAPSFSDQTLAIGSPIPTGALFSPPSFSGDSPLHDRSEPFVLNAPEAMPVESASAIEGPPDSLPGFSFATTSGPLPSFEAPPDEESAVVSRKELVHTDSPLELANEGVIEHHAHEPSVIEERRDPLLDTFADVADATAGVASTADPELELNAQPAGSPSLTVRPSEDLTSAWDPQAQPPKAFEPEAEPEPEPEPEPTPAAGAWGTSSYEVGATPFALADEPSPSSGTPFEMPTDAEPPFSMPAGISEEAARAPLSGETLRAGGATKAFTPGVGSQTQRFTADELDQLSSVDETPTFGDSDEMQALEPAPTDWTPEIEPPSELHGAVAADVEMSEAVTDDLSEEAAGVEELSVASHETSELVEPPVGESLALDQADGAATSDSEESTLVAAAVETVRTNGSASAGGTVPQSVIDEVVRRAMERIDDELIREIAWEVIPDLAEKMILKRLGGE